MVLNKDNELRNKLSKLIRLGREGLYLRVYVVPKARKLEIILENDELILYINESCKRHRVNQGVVSYFRKIFKNNVEVRIVRGKYERMKIIEVKGITQSEALELLTRHITTK